MTQGMVMMAVITAAHGIKGEVKVKSFTARPADFASYGPLADKNGRIFEVKKVRAAKDDFICTLKDITDRNAAETLRGMELFVPRERLPAPQNGEIYLADVQGKVAFADGKTLGRIAGFQNFGAGELLELENGMLIPVRCIVSAADVVTLDLPTGFLDSHDEEAAP